MKDKVIKLDRDWKGRKLYEESKKRGLLKHPFDKTFNTNER